MNPGRNAELPCSTKNIWGSMWTLDVTLLKLPCSTKNIWGSVWTLDVTLSYLVPRRHEQTYLCDKVEHCVGEHIDSRAARYDERMPPPMVVLQDISTQITRWTLLELPSSKTTLSSCILGPWRYYEMQAGWGWVDGPALCVQTRLIVFQSERGCQIFRKSVTLEWSRLDVRASIWEFFEFLLPFS